MDQLVRNERTKLTATYLNGLAIAVFDVGGIAPVFNAINHVDSLTLALA